MTVLKLEKMKKNIIILTAIAGFFIANFILSPLPLRLDLSKGQAYTLSKSSKKIITSLDKPTEITFFASSDLPTRLLPLKSEVIDLLQEYDRSSSKVDIQTLDPKKDSKSLEQVKAAGIPELQFSQVENDKYAVVTGYFGILVSYDNKKETIPQVTDVESLEYNLTSAIYKLSNKNLPQVGVMGFDAATSQTEELSSLKTILSKQFTLTSVNLTEENKKIDSSIKALLVFDTNTKQYTDKEINAIKDYLKNKGKAIFFVDGVWIDDNLQATPSKSNLGKITSDYGIKIQNNLILSYSSELVNFGNDVVSFLTPYPFWIKTSSFNEKTSYFSNVNQLIFPWISSLSLEKKKGIEQSELVYSTPNSWEQNSNFVLNPQQIPQPKEESFKKFMIAAEAKKTDRTHLIVIPSSRFVQNRYISRNSSSMELILNMLNVQASQGSLAGINQRAVGIYPIPTLSSTQQDIFKYANILILPALFALYGAYRLFKRK